MTASIAAGAGAALLWSLPFGMRGAVRSAVIERARAMTGLETEIADVSVSWTGVTLSGLSIGDAKRGLLVRVSRTQVDANPLWLALRGASGVASVAIEGVQVETNVDREGLREILSRARARSAGAAASGKSNASSGSNDSNDSSGSNSRARELPSLRVSGISVVVADDEGDLLRVREMQVRTEQSMLVASVPSIELGSRGHVGIDLNGLDVHAEPSGRVRKASLRRAVLRDVEQTVEIRALIRRLLDAVPERAEGGASEPSKPSQTAIGSRWTGAELELLDGRVLRRDGAEVLSGLRGKASVHEGDQVRLTGQGRAEERGAIGWDFRLWPASLRAEGKLEAQALPLRLLAPLLPDVPWHEPEAAHIDAKLVLTAESAERIAVSGEVRAEGLAIASARVAATPVAIGPIAISGDGHFVPAARRLEITAGQLELTGAKVDLSGSVSFARPDYAIDLALSMPRSRCTDAIHSIPAALLGDLALATWRGTLGGTLRVKVDSRTLAETELDLSIEDHCEFVTVPALADLRRFTQPFVHQALEPDGSAFEMETGPTTLAWTYLEDVSPFFVHAVLAHEDAGFFSHRGFSLLHIRNALARNLEEGRYVVGASTITMQLVKNVFLHREKTLARKIQEVLLTWWIERVLPKSDILELYLNVIEYGPSVYGIRHAARHYFGRLPAQLSPAESAFLATILPNPKRYHDYYTRGEVPASWLERMRKLLVRLRARGSYDVESTEYGLQELSSFSFVPEGALAKARVIPGSAAQLPYMERATGLPYIDELDAVFERPDDEWDKVAPR